MRRFRSTLLPALFFFALLFPGHAYAAVVINEIAPKFSDPTWEWVELYNTDATSVSLDRWKIDHTAGDAKSFILNASFIIQPHGFLALLGSQTAIAFSIDGDTVRLFDANGALVDSKGYPGTLGYNTSMGRSTDGGDGWVICTPDPYKATPNTNNNCPPAPSPTPTPSPTSTPAQSPPTPTPVRQTFAALLPTPTVGATVQPTAQVLGVVNTPAASPTPAPGDLTQIVISKMWIVYTLTIIAAGALVLMAVMLLRQWKRRGG